MVKPKNVVDEEVRDSSRDQVATSLRHLRNCFSSIFEALVVVSGLQLPNSPLERDKIGRRSREFDVRLKRNSFELKQQVSIIDDFLTKIAKT